MRARRYGLTLVSAFILFDVLSGSGSAARADDHPPKAPPAAKPAEKAPPAAQATPGQPVHGKSAQEPAARPDRAAAPKKEAESDSRGGAAETEGDSSPVSAERALILLGEGNRRWVEGKPQHPNAGEKRRVTVAEHGQKPFVSILTCADSRIPVERVFDRGVGELFVIRVAGNVAGGSEVGTIEYGVEHLKTPLLVVMGHSRCGAVAAAASGAELHGKVAELVSNIVPAVDRARRNAPGAADNDLISAAIRENVWQSVYDLYKSSPVVLEMVKHHELRVVGAVYDVSSGTVEWLGPHPWESELLTALEKMHATSHAPAADHK